MKGNFTFNVLRGIRNIRSKDQNLRSEMALRLRGISTNIPEIQPKRLEGKMALIIGAATGIGETTAQLFAAHGARVLVADVQEAAGSKVAADLGNGADFIRCDVRSEDDVAAAVDKAVTMAESKTLDVFHYNAGILGAFGPLHEMKTEDFDYTMNVNLRGAVLGVKHAARVMKPAGKGSILCTGSIAAVVAGMGPHAYTISKTAMGGLVRTAALELRRFGIRVNMVSPNFVPTPILTKALEMLQMAPNCSMESAEKWTADSSPMGGRPLTRLDLAHAALFLASDECSYMSGHNLVVDAAHSVAHSNDTVRWYTDTVPMF